LEGRDRRRLGRGARVWSDVPAVAEPVVYGLSLFVSAIAERLGVALIEPPPGWLSSVPRPLLGREVSLATLGDARALVTQAFVKPADDKAFPPRVYRDGAELAETSAAYPADLAVYISTPVRFTVEYRCFLLEGAVETASIYLREGEVAEGVDGDWPCDPTELEAATAFASDAARAMSGGIPPAVVLDVGKIDGGAFAVVEANPCWGSGLCACDASAILRVLRRATVDPARIGDDARWVRPFGA
jgi:hypothetical protein